MILIFVDVLLERDLRDLIELERANTILSKLFLFPLSTLRSEGTVNEAFRDEFSMLSMTYELVIKGSGSGSFISEVIGQ